MKWSTDVCDAAVSITSKCRGNQFLDAFVRCQTPLSCQSLARSFCIPAIAKLNANEPTDAAAVKTREMPNAEK